MRHWGEAITTWTVACALFAACKDDENNDKTGGCDLTAQDCDEGTVCEATAEGVPMCALPLLIRGSVMDAADATAVEGALIQASDPNLTPLGTSDVSAADGAFSLRVPAKRGKDGVPIEGNYLIRAQASGYQLFPSGIRQSLPLDAKSAVEETEGWVIDSALTAIALIGLPDGGANLGTISGTIHGEPCAGILVVAEQDGVGLPGYSDATCAYTIVNVPQGSYTVKGYTAGLQLSEAPADVGPKEQVEGVDLEAVSEPLGTVSGNVQIVNAPGGAVTSVVLAVESTFIENTARGVVPPGLRAGEVTGAFVIADVPAGKYVVLAAFENDDLVRDPDESIGGTQIVHIEVPDPTAGTDITLSEGFKVTEALAVVSPGAGAPEPVSDAAPVFEWADDSSEDGYTVTVFDAFGEVVWETEAASVSGDKHVTLAYAGPALEPGMYYQFRVTSFKETKDGRTAISTTEDLEGVFYFEAPK